MAEKTDLVLYDSDEDTSEDDDNTGDDSTPSPRFWHFSQLVKGNVYVGGGNIPQYKKKKARARLLRTIEEFSVKERKWRQRETTGDHHPGLTGVACASFGKYLFAYGGNNAKLGLNGVLSQLDLDTFIWSQLSPETADGPMKKDASGMVHFGEDGLAVMCGYATPRDRIKLDGGSSDRDSRFIIREGPSADGDGWTNEMHIFNHKTKGMWTPFSFEGPRPPPCADFSLTSVDLYRAILYGGRRGADENSNDLYVIDFSEKKITKIKPESKEDKWPKMRLGHHAACFLDFNTKNPQLLISGGRIKHELPPKDIWILNLATQKWKQVELPIDDDSIKNQLAQWGHTFTAITHSEGLIEVIMFGGSPGYYEVTWDVYKRRDFKRLSFPASFVLGFLNKEWLILDVLDCSMHWTSKIVGSMPFNLDSPIMLDVLHSMERDKIPILTELVTNKKIRSTICTEDKEARFKWPIFTRASLHEPTWETLISILEMVEQNDLMKNVKRYLKKRKEFVLQDVEVCGKKTFEITPSSTEPLEWEEYGLKLYPQKDCLLPGVDKVTVNILASIAGQYVFPEDCYLISSVFWLRCQPKCSFAKPIKLQMEHCANTNDLTKLTFVRASTSSLPYSFKELEGGQFFISDCKDRKDHRGYGTIELSQFCGVTMCQKESNEQIYYAGLFFRGKKSVPDNIHIAMTWNESGHLTELDKEYKHDQKIADEEITFESESDSITLDIPMEGKNIDGWKLIPLTYPKITKLQMQDFKPGQRIPSFRLKVESDRFSRSKGLIYQLILHGAKLPWNVFNIIISAEASRKRIRTIGAVEDALRPRKMLDQVRKYHSSEDFTFKDPASLDTSGSNDSEFEDDCIEPPPSAKREKLMEKSKDSGAQADGGRGSAHGSSTANTTSDNQSTLPTVLRILLPLSNQWMNIGTMLSLSQERLTAIETRCRGVPDNCLREMLNEWFQQDNPQPAKSALVNAVKAYNPSLAEEISAACENSP